MKVLAFAVVAALLVPPAVAAQSLGEVAAKDKERRKKEKAGKVYTEEDLRRAGGEARGAPDQEASQEGAASSAAAPSGSGAASSTPAEGEKVKTQDEIRAEKRQELERRVEMEKKVIERVRERMESAQRELGDLSNYTYGTRRAALMKVLEDGEKELALAEQNLANIEEEGRRMGIVISR